MGNWATLQRFPIPASVFQTEGRSDHVPSVQRKKSLFCEIRSGARKSLPDSGKMQYFAFSIGGGTRHAWYAQWVRRAVLLPFRGRGGTELFGEKEPPFARRKTGIPLPALDKRRKSS